MTSLTSFTLFPLLPPELRLHIYHHACHPRVTTLSYLPAPRDTYQCLTPPPTLLHISRESRAEGLRLYAKCLLPPSPSSPPEQTEPSTEDDENHPRRYFYHHPHLDTLYLPRPPPAADPLGLGYADWAREFAAGIATTTVTVTATATPKGPAAAGAGVSGLAGVVRRLAVDYVPAEVRRPWEVFGKVCLIRGCPLLEEAYLVVGGGGGGGDGGPQQPGSGSGAGWDAGRREVEFVDPAVGDAEIVRIMERVRASFRVELGDGNGLVGVRGEGKEDAGEHGVQAGLELVPKAMVLSPWGCRHVACAS
ncbi:hypothetical protein B0I37DRAFT_63638 [Chaetomium sp. MPI-CAGE-AT-0009]|nr:hypothetical protein B0I37DRAFT_63638 [Chaetomium sp. MPI-CAGE-AT-0009]